MNQIISFEHRVMKQLNVEVVHKAKVYNSNIILFRYHYRKKKESFIIIYLSFIYLSMCHSNELTVRDTIGGEWIFGTDDLSLFTCNLHLK